MEGSFQKLVITDTHTLFVISMKYFCFVVTMTSSTGLAFSGGGIRSAAFCSGVLRRLLECEVEVDYLSCVSGGGYTGTAYLDWKYREERRQGKQGEARRDWHEEFFDHMKDRTGYVCNWKKPLQGIFDTIILSCLIILVTFVQPMIIWGSYACPVAFMVDLLFGKYLREKVDCDAVAIAAAKRSGKTDDAAFDLSVEQVIRQHCLDRQGTAGTYTITLFAVLFILFIALHVFLRLKCLSPLQSLFVRLSQYTFGAFLVLTFIPFSIHDFFDKIPLWAKIASVPLCVIVWLVLPLLRKKTSYVLIILFYSYVTHWKVYEGKAIGIMFSPKLFNRLLFASGFVIWVVPMVASVHERAVHIYNRLVKVPYSDQLN